MSKFAVDLYITNIDNVIQRWYKFNMKKEVDYMLLDDIDKLKLKLEKQIQDNEPYDVIYKTSVEIDKLLVKYYSSLKDTKKDLNC